MSTTRTTAIADPPSELMRLLNAWYDGSIEDGDLVVLFQHLVDTGSAWRLGDEFATMANFLIEEGDVVPRAKHVEAIQAYISMH